MSKVRPIPQRPRYDLSVIQPVDEPVKPVSPSVIQVEPTKSSVVFGPNLLWIGLAALLFICLIIAVVVPIAVVSNTGITTIATTTVSTICPTTAISISLTLSPLPNQCSNYTTIDDPTRNPADTSASSCDSLTFTSQPVWVLFNGSGGSLLASCPVPESSCATDHPGWYTGLYPSTAGGISYGVVCFIYDDNACLDSIPILITNCNGFYIYYLTAPPSCDERYCTI